MNQSVKRIVAAAGVTAIVATAFGLGALRAGAQTSTMQQKVAAVKATMAKNEQMLGQYTWQQQEVISVGGDVKKSVLYQVSLGSEGKPVKVDISQSAPSSGRKFGIRHRIAQDYIDYGQQVASLAASYAQPDPGRLQQLYSQGSVSLKPAGTDGLFSLVARGYVKPGDTLTITFDKAQKAVVGLQVASYLSSPSDAVTIDVSFARLPDGTNHAATINVDGQSKNLTIQQTNFSYTKRT
jgi:hypothetical protein